MSEKDNGGTAFPTTEFNYEKAWSGSGMTLRDYFAAQVIGPILVTPVHHKVASRGVGVAAETAYEIADAMLEARKK